MKKLFRLGGMHFNFLIGIVMLILLPILFTVNISPSLPTGIYVRQFGRPIQPGAVVRLVGKPRGRRLDLLKYVAAIPGQLVFVSSDQYITPGTVWPFKAMDSIPVQEFKGPVPAGHIFVAGSHPLSYDSRYFGPVPITQIVGQYKPLWVSDEDSNREKR